MASLLNDWTKLYCRLVLFPPVQQQLRRIVVWISVYSCCYSFPFFPTSSG